MKYILIAFLWNFNGGGGISQEFDTLNACDYAAQTILTYHEKATDGPNPTNFAICLPKK